MSPSIRNLGSFVREQRNVANLTQSELAKMVGISEETLSAIERNKRPISRSVLTPLFTALGVEPEKIQAMTGLHAGVPVPAQVTPNPQELSALEAIATPACYQDIHTYRIVAANAAARVALPGLAPGTSLVEWLMADPRSRRVVGDWEKAAHGFVYSLKVLALGAMEPEISGPIIETCRRAPEWERMWNTRPVDPRPFDTLIHIHPETGVEREMYITSFAVQFPRSGWWLWMLSPVRESDSAPAG
ncbi:MmyB family transcriptional regulator [Nocardia sp. NPDC003482]